jgi:cell division septum initiation protein DivIVA
MVLHHIGFTGGCPDLFYIQLDEYSQPQRTNQNLENQVNRLEEQNDRFTKLNNELNATVQELNFVAKDLNETAIRLAEINDDLNTTNFEFKDRITELTAQNEAFKGLNEDLNRTVLELESQVNRFQNAIATLILQNAELSNYTDALANITGSLEDITSDQNATIRALEVALGELVGENDRLEDLNIGLETIVGFLNETSAEIGESLEQVADFLAEQITTSRVLVLGNLETSSQTKISNWDCDYRDVYREKTYGTDFDAPIPPGEIAGIVAYVNDRILSDLCLIASDFENYLSETYSDSLTSNRVVTAVTNYVSAALDWYFSDGQGGEGISHEQWAEAGYRCQNLPDQFEFVSETII